ncbi:MAG: SDR family NAD(P)-dependent oxidoreductase [Actinoallomurus sp.]
MTDLTGKTALVTGASRGIGRAIARRLAADGASVAVHYGSNDVAAKETVAAIAEAGGSAFTIRAEFGVPGDIDTLFSGLTDGLGDRRLDILVNNAGIARSDATITQATVDAFDRLFAVNVRTPLFVIQRALPLMSDGGRIINVGSAVARMAVSTELVYSMTKAAVQMLSTNLANVLGTRGITVNTLAPGMTRTDTTAMLEQYPEFEASINQITALDRLGEPAEIAAAAAFLASDDGRWVTGTTLDVSGGIWLGPRIP